MILCDVFIIIVVLFDGFILLNIYVFLWLFMSIKWLGLFFFKIVLMMLNIGFVMNWLLILSLIFSFEFLKFGLSLYMMFRLFVYFGGILLFEVKREKLK